MKTIMLSLLLTFSTQSFAGCVDDFNAGFNEFDFAAKYFDTGLDSYNKAVELSRSSNPVFLTICNHLVDSVTGFSVSKSSYTNCKENFLAATTTCAGPDIIQATKNMEVCSGNATIARDNHGAVVSLLKNTCFKNSGKLEVLELENSINLL